MTASSSSLNTWCSGREGEREREREREEKKEGENEERKERERSDELVILKGLTFLCLSPVSGGPCSSWNSGEHDHIPHTSYRSGHIGSVPVSLHHHGYHTEASKGKA